MEKITGRKIQYRRTGSLGGRHRWFDWEANGFNLKALKTPADYRKAVRRLNGEAKTQGYSFRYRSVATGE